MKRKKHRVGALDKETAKAAGMGLLDGVLAGAGAIAAQEFGAFATPMIPASVLSPVNAGYAVDVLKIVLGGVVPAFIPGTMREEAKAVGAGFAAQGAINLFNVFMATPTYVRVGGADNRMYALAGGRRGVRGADNRMYALAGGQRFASGPSTRSTPSFARGL